jgi:thiol-disulfide isomerase/thioredoxin
MKKYLCLALVLVPLVVLPGCGRKEKPALEGNAAPDFTLKDLSGKPVPLSSLRGKVVLLNFWATWCPPCRQEIPSMMLLNKSMEGKPFQMLAVSEDAGGKEAVEGYFKESGTALPALLDTEQAVGQRYGLTGVPETFIIGKNGVILKKVVGAMDWNNPDAVNFLQGAMK